MLKYLIIILLLSPVLFAQTVDIPGNRTVDGTLNVTGDTTVQNIIINGTCTGTGCGTGGGGSGNISGTLVNNNIPVAAGTNTLQPSNLTDDGTTLTYVGTGGMSLTGSGASLFQPSPGPFSSLPTCNLGQEGSHASISDSTTNTWGAIVTGGGTLHVSTYCDGTQWTVAGGHGTGGGGAVSSVTGAGSVTCTPTTGNVICTGTGGGSTLFSAITTSTNTSATMTVGSGAAIAVTGTGTINANRLNGAVVPANAAVAGTQASGQIVVATAHGMVAPFTCTGTGTATAQTCSTTPTFVPALGDKVIFNPGTTNTGSLTLNVNSSTAAPVHKWLGTALASGDAPAGEPVMALFDGTNWNLSTIGNAPSGGGGGVSSVTASAPLASSGGATPNVSLTGIVPVANGGNGTASPALIQGTNVTITGSWPNQTINATSGGGGLADPGSNGVIKRTALNVTAPATFGDVTALWTGGSCTGTNYLGADGACHASSGGASVGTNSVQFSNGSGGFIANANLKGNTTNGWLGIGDSSGFTLGYPLDLEFTAQDTAAGNVIAMTTNETVTGSAGSANFIHTKTGITTHSGFNNGTSSTNYQWLYSYPYGGTGASTSGHELNQVFRTRCGPGAAGNPTPAVTSIGDCAGIYMDMGVGNFGGTGGIWNVNNGQANTIGNVNTIMFDTDQYIAPTSGTVAITKRNYIVMPGAPGSLPAGITMGNITGIQIGVGWGLNAIGAGSSYAFHCCTNGSGGAGSGAMFIEGNSGTDRGDVFIGNNASILFTGSGSIALPSSATAVTQTVGDNSTKVATDAFVLANAGSGGGLTASGPPLIHQLALWTTATNLKGLSVGSSNTVVHGVTGGDPVFGQVVGADLAPQYPKLRCEPGLGDGLNAMPAGNYLQTTCYNDSGVTWTITGIKCFTDNAGTSTLAASGQTLGNLLASSITCTPSFAAGTLSTNIALTSGDYINFTFASDGASKQTTWVVSFTQ